MEYRPSATNLAKYPELEQLAASGAAIPRHAFHHREPDALRLLPGGQLYFDSGLELDTDGWPGGADNGDPTYQIHTSYRLKDGTSIDANRVPYFVLPQPVDWVKSFGIWLGDVAAVIWEGKLAFAVFADFGGKDSIGEGSMQLFRALKEERLGDNGRIINRGLPSKGAVTIVFPGSRPALKYRTVEDLIAETQKRGMEHFEALFGTAAAPLTASKSLAAAIVDAAVQEFRQYGGTAENVEPLNSRIHDYWQKIGERFYGTDSKQFWSAAFISFVVREAGGGKSLAYSARHSTYIYRAIHDRRRGVPDRFWAYRPQDISIAPGDLLAMNQTGSRTIAFEEARHDDSYPSHCDIVTEVSADEFRTIGGNVGAKPGTVGKKTFAWRRGDLVRDDNHEQQVFAVLRPPPMRIA